LARTLPVDLQDDVVACGQLRLELLAARAVVVVEYLRVLKKPAGQHELSEIIGGGEVVLAAVALVGAGCAGRV
jgi:hypothetical protein